MSYKVSSITGIGKLSIYGKFISRFLENAVEQQMFNDTEHIIVYAEDGDEMSQFEKFSNFKLIKEKESKGVYNAWNIGIESSTTDYITNWNIDDIRHPSNIKMKYELLENNYQYSIAYNYYVATKDKTETFYTIEPQGKSYLNFPDNYEEWAATACLIGPDPMWRKEIHSKIGLFDYINFKTIGDWEMWLRMAQAGYKFKIIPEILCIYLDHTETVSSLSQSNDSLNQQYINLKNKYNNFRTKFWEIKHILL